MDRTEQNIDLVLPMLTERQLGFLRVFAASQPLTPKEFIALVGLRKSSGYKLFDALKESGAIAKTGREIGGIGKPTSRYVLTELAHIALEEQPSSPCLSVSAEGTTSTELRQTDRCLGATVILYDQLELNFGNTQLDLGI